MRPGVSIARAACLLPALACACSGGKAVVLGSGSPIPYHFDAPMLVAELSSTSRTDNPTLTSDLLEIYFTSDRVSGNGDVWFATRASPDAPFGTPAAVAAVNSDSFETSSAISGDGLSLWFGSDRAGGSGGVDIWVSQRLTRAAAWSTPANVVSLNSLDDDIPRPPGQRALVMPMSSTKMAPKNPVAGNYQTYLAPRATTGVPFGAPVAILELDYEDRSTVDGFLTDDGLTMFFSSAPVTPTVDAAAPVDGGKSMDAGRTVDAGKAADAGKNAGGDAGAASSDLYVAYRRSTNEAFGFTEPLTDLNTPADERDPWLSPDGTTLYFTSDRGGVLNVYTAHVQPR
jgi:hypothetical protein